MQVHKENIEKVPNSIKGRDNITLEICGMENIPREDLIEHEKQKFLYASSGGTLDSDEEENGAGSDQDNKSPSSSTMPPGPPPPPLPPLPPPLPPSQSTPLQPPLPTKPNDLAPSMNLQMPLLPPSIGKKNKWFSKISQNF